MGFIKTGKCDLLDEDYVQNLTLLFASIIRTVSRCVGVSTWKRTINLNKRRLTTSSISLIELVALTVRE